MDETNLARREAEVIPPEGGIFLCTEGMIPDFVMKGLMTLNDERKRSARAQRQLERALQEGSERRAGTSLSTYGKELEAYVHYRSADPDDRSLDETIVQSVETIEHLYDQSSVYRGIRDGLRITADKVSSLIVEQMSLGESIRIGLHDYERVRGPFEHEFLCRMSDDDQPLVLFDWGGDVDGIAFVRAQLRDQIVLLSDVIVYNGEQVSR